MKIVDLKTYLVENPSPGRGGGKCLFVFLVLAMVLSFSACGSVEASAELYVDQGNELAKVGDYDGAVDEYSEAIRLNPRIAIAYHDRGFAYFMLGQLRRAIEDFNDAIRLDPGHVYTYHNRGLAYDMLGMQIEAIADFEKVITLTDNPQLIEFAGRRIEALSR